MEGTFPPPREKREEDQEVDPSEWQAFNTECSKMRKAVPSLGRTSSIVCWKCRVYMRHHQQKD